MKEWIKALVSSLTACALVVSLGVLFGVGLSIGMESGGIKMIAVYNAQTGKIEATND